MNKMRSFNGERKHKNEPKEILELRNTMNEMKNAMESINSRLIKQKK